VGLKANPSHSFLRVCYSSRDIDMAISVVQLNLESSKLVCPHCGSTRLVLDPVTHELVCARCGTVVEERLPLLEPPRIRDEDERVYLTYDHIVIKPGAEVVYERPLLLRALKRLSQLFDVSFTRVVDIFVHEYAYVKSLRRAQVSDLREWLKSLMTNRRPRRRILRTCVKAALVRTIIRLMIERGWYVSYTRIRDVYFEVTGRDTLSFKYLRIVASDLVSKALSLARPSELAVQIAYEVPQRLGIKVDLEFIKRVREVVGFRGFRTATLAAILVIAITELLGMKYMKVDLVRHVNEVCVRYGIKPLAYTNLGKIVRTVVERARTVVGSLKSSNTFQYVAL